MADSRSGERPNAEMTRQRLLRYLLGDLPDDQTAAVNEQLAHEPALRDQLDRLRRMRTTLLSARTDSFGPYFKERVLRRLHPAFAADGAQVLYDSLRTAFARAAIACLLAAAALGTLNVLAYGEGEVASSLPEAVFGLPSATLMDALEYDAL